MEDYIYYYQENDNDDMDVYYNFCKDYDIEPEVYED